MFLHELDLIKVKKILQVSRTLRINVQLLSLNQFDRNTFKLMIVDSHLIVDTNLAFIFLQKRTQVCHLFRILIFIFLSHFFIKRSSIAINIRSWCFHEFNYWSFAITRKLDLLFFYKNFILVAQLLKTFKEFNDVMFIEM